MTNKTKILTGLLAGAALGAAVALILSSDKSDDLKAKVGDWFCDLLDSSKSKLGDVTGMVKDSLTKVNA